MEIQQTWCIRSQWPYTICWLHTEQHQTLAFLLAGLAFNMAPPCHTGVFFVFFLPVNCAVQLLSVCFLFCPRVPLEKMLKHLLLRSRELFGAELWHQHLQEKSSFVLTFVHSQYPCLPSFSGFDLVNKLARVEWAARAFPCVPCLGWHHCWSIWASVWTTVTADCQRQWYTG